MYIFVWTIFAIFSDVQYNFRVQKSCSKINYDKSYRAKSVNRAKSSIIGRSLWNRPLLLDRGLELLAQGAETALILTGETRLGKAEAGSCRVLSLLSSLSREAWGSWRVLSSSSSPLLNRKLLPPMVMTSLFFRRTLPRISSPLTIVGLVDDRWSRRHYKVEWDQIDIVL